MCDACNRAGGGGLRWKRHPEQQLAASKLGADRARKHGKWRHPLYKVWAGMMARCYNPNHPGFKNYGARGITVCQPWHDAGAFIAWVEQNLGPRPDDYTMDRIDNDCGYEPGNMRWATRSVQRRNQRSEGRPHGSAMSAALLTEQIVRECRKRWAAGEGQKELAAEYGVSKPTMHKALVGKTWRHVTDGD